MSTGLKANSDGLTGELQVNGSTVLSAVAAGISIPGTLTVTGVVSPAALLDISGASAGQIKFPATQNASANANTLDDYKEGTWTPTWNGGSVTVSTAAYTKIGRLVFINCDLTLGTSSSGSISYLTTPFTNINPYAGGSLVYADYSAGVLNVDISSLGIAFRSGNGGQLACSTISGSRWIFSGTYMTS